MTNQLKEATAATRRLVETFLATYGSDLAAVADMMTPDARWEINGQVQTRTAAEFVERQAADLATGEATTTVETLVVEGNEAAWIGWATFTPHEGGESMRMRMTEWFSVVDGRISVVRDVMAQTE